MLKHHCSALFTFSPMLKHHYSALLFLPTPKTLQSTISSPSFIDETTPSSNCFAFSLLLLKHPYQQLFIFFPLLKHRCQQPFIIFPDAETPLFNTFSSSHSQNTPVHHFLTIFIDETSPSNNCFAFPLLMLKHHCSALFTFSPMLKHHYSTLLFLPTPKTLHSTISLPFSSTKQLHPTIVSPFPFCC
jgi:hypothetical protein